MMTNLLAVLVLAQSYEEFRRQAFKKEDEGAWKKIDWQKDVKTALEKGVATGKPILVALVVGEMGKKGAAEC